ncbi:sigma-70 family RNA polymerase sigma factor [Bacillus aquiflavi]|uniref:Sigma-70 family RNA polymerase sigma factor n=2 Tax=Bacillus aquiflavi TaxID=2672567 RepID=A0A6B3W2N4_9BACI|nr:sigma-70 family RNA polymerase sigma factor [Bacillus aquiflavi]MBA4538634.1 sigma-70 family RNA polymerase sigma factor [Bacillus aquiflavi]NEY82995.1 sigma-70 family RNA polymerase sigma factor [Bacillus aquiflavi]UAC47883.1 sigma-70 family RNA polymerase sigma factor [Bacillus aquiflavi]
MDSFDQLVKQYSPMIHKIIKSLHIYKNREEYYQIGLIALWDAAIRFDHKKGRFISYAYMYIRGRIMTELTKSCKGEEISFYPKEEFWDSIIDFSPKDPLELEVLLSYCTGLTLKQRKWVIYTFYFGLRQTEIALIEQISISAVKQYRKAALCKIKANILSQ